MVKDDTLDTAMTGLAAVINAGTGDPAVFAEFEPRLETIKLVARKPGTDGNNIALAVSGVAAVEHRALPPSPSRPAEPRSRAVRDATILAPGTLVTLLGQ